VVLFHCTSAYPAPAESLNLRALCSMARDYGEAAEAAEAAPSDAAPSDAAPFGATTLTIGYSDHSEGIEAPLAAVALGARVIEKHLTLDKNLPGPDHSASLEPDEFARMVGGIRRVCAMLGDGVKAPTAAELNTALVARRSVVSTGDWPAGTVLTADMLTCRRPATGIAPKDLGALIGRSLAGPVRAGQVLQWADLNVGGDA
jgi:N,N'-diacetyllegionaminate synthase